MQSGLKQWMTAAFKLQCEHKGMPRAWYRSTGEGQAGHLGGGKVDKGTTTGTADFVRYVVRGMENDKDGGCIQTNEAVGRTKIPQECYGRKGTIVPHTGSEDAFNFEDLPILRIELCTFKHYDTLLAEDT